MSIVFPDTFEQLLAGDRGLRSGIDAMLVAFKDWLSTSRLPFFTDYTDHGAEHLSSVLATADRLITPDAKSLLTPSDTAVLVASTLLHDSAMHLSEAGFYQLIAGNASTWRIDGFDDLPWPTLWDDFIFSAKRWTDQKLLDVFGANERGQPRAQVRDPMLTYDDLRDTDRKLIGEFIRQNHPRMAHEFALHGIPGKMTVDLGGTLPKHLRDLAGLVARSHGHHVRRYITYLQQHYHRREYDGVHTIYLMAVLRLSDFLQIQADRAPTIVFKYRHISSKQSEIEWRAHNSVVNITQTHDDPESLEVQAHPPDVYTYLRLKEWLAGIQSEMDASWAVLGEIYGSQAALSHLGLRLRRVRSNLDDTRSFGKTAPYVPELIQMRVARIEVLKLLVGPLYDNAASVGIRELMQNAIDAVREREVLQGKDQTLKHSLLREQECDVEVWLNDLDEDGYALLTISDRGIGMSLPVIRDFFLTAGVSFRSSEAWKREFESPTAESPRSRVLRSGRFGVGVLAGFLLGERMEIETRHIRDPDGMRFEVGLDLAPIALCRDIDLRVGTTIRIRVSANVHEMLTAQARRDGVPGQFDWYVYDEPSVARFVGHKKKKLTPLITVGAPYKGRPSSLRRLRWPGDYAVYWTYEPIPTLTVNGIYVTTSQARERFSSTPSGSAPLDIVSYVDSISVALRHPKIAIEDPDGICPLNLKRTDFTESPYPFENNLKLDIVHDYLAYLLTNCPESIGGACQIAQLSHAGVSVRASVNGTAWSCSVSPYVATAAGICFTPAIVAHDTAPRVLYLTTPDMATGMLDYALRERGAYAAFLGGFHSLRGGWTDWLSPEHTDTLKMLGLALTLTDRSRGSSWRWLTGAREIRGVRIYAPKASIAFLRDSDQLKRRLKQQERFAAKEFEQERQEYLSFVVAAGERFASDGDDGRGLPNIATLGCPASSFGLVVLGQRMTAPLMEVFLDAGPPIDALGDTAGIVEQWQRIFGPRVIPYDHGARRLELNDAYRELRDFIPPHEQMKGRGVSY